MTVETLQMKSHSMCLETLRNTVETHVGLIIEFIASTKPHPFFFLLR